ncbi:MAG: transcription antitermination factor NusB [Alphaproteobacteria bacterium]|nr:MAG: transcription antitermination factor NusB [Alphaproteobacteria bacterium]
MARQPQKNKTGGPRSAARLAAVQALYQLEMSDEPKPKVVIQEYIRHRLGAEIEGDQYVDADQDLFADIAEGGWGRREEWDAAISPCLSSDWPLERLENIIRAIFRAGAYELAVRPDVPTAVIINEYVDVAHAFYEKSEAAFVNGVLDKLAKSLR